MIFIRPFEVSDYNAFEPVEVIEGTVDPEFAQAIEDSSLAVTGIRNGRVWGCGGVHPIDEFHGEMWLRLSKECLDFPIETMRWLKAGMKIIEATYPFKQLNATIKCGFEKSIKMIEYLGFTKTETVEDWLIYSKRVQE